MATASTTTPRPTTPPEVMSRFMRITLPLMLTFALGSLLIGTLVYLIYTYVQRRGSESEFVFRRLEESLSIRGAEVDPRWWLVALIPLLTLGFVYAGWQYVRDGRAVGPAWAAFMALLRCTVYGVLAFAFLLPATQAWEVSRNQSKVLFVFDVSPSMVFIKDDVPTEKIPYDKLLTRQDKVLEFLADNRINFLGRLQAKNPVTAYRFGRLLDEDYHIFDRTEGTGWHFYREEWDAYQRDPEGWKNKEPSKILWTNEDWIAWLKPRFDAPPADLKEDERKKLLDIIDNNQHMFATTNLGEPLLSMLNREGNNLLQGIIIVSDGRSTEGGPAAVKELTERAKKNKIPIFVVAIGEDRPHIQLEFTDLRLPKLVRPDDEFQIFAELNGIGLAGQEVEVKLEAYKPSNPKEKIEVATQKVRFSVGQLPHAQAEFKMTPKPEFAGIGDGATPTKPGETAKPEYEVGEWTFIARVAKDRREVFPDPEHKTDAATLQVQRKPLSVLLVASGPSREYQFVRTFFVREMDKGRADLCIYLQPPPGRDQPRPGVVNDVPDARLLKEFPNRFEDPGKGGGEIEFSNLGHYDVVIAFDPDWSRLSSDQMKLIQRWVDLGHGLILVGGPIHTLDLARPVEAAEAIKPMLDLYPVVLEDARIQNLDRLTNDPWRLNFQGVTPEMEFMRLDEGQDAMANPLKAWEDFFFSPENANAPKGQPAIRGFYNYYPVKHPKDGTQVIATFSDPLAKMADGREQPYLAFMPYGTGKVFWIGSGEMWRLRAYKESYHDRFWVKLARFVGSGSLTQLNRRIHPYVGTTHRANSFVNFDVRVLGKDMKPLDERAKPRLVLTPPRGATEKEMSYDMVKKLSTAEGWTGTFTSRFLVRAPGEYQYKIDVTETGDTETGKFVVKESNPELDNSRPDFEQLWELASEADDHLVRIKDDLVRRKIKDTLTRPRPVSADEKAEKKAEAKAEDRPRFLFDLRTAELIPDCVSYDYREQRSRGAAEDWWDGGYPWDKPKEERWFSWILAVIVALLSFEWLARKLLRLA
jgi:hypothetical protein